MIERVTIEAREIVPGDMLADQDGPEVSYVEEWSAGGIEVVEVFGADGPPIANYEPGESVTVWREVSQ